MAREHYLGNELLKGQGVPVEWTPELKEEYKRCRNDPVYFAKKYIKIVTDQGLVPFVMRDYQEDMIRSFYENRFNMANCSRQSGKTETTRAFVLHYILFNSHKTVAIMANKGETSNEILSKIQMMYQNLPRWLQQGVVKFSATRFVLENGCRVIAAATGRSAIRGYTVHVLIIDEAAHVENWSTFYQAVAPTISASKTSKLIMLSTPNGLNHFYKFWDDSEKGNNDYKRFFIPWHRVPGRDEEWARIALQNDCGNDPEKFAQEYECEFLGSSGTLIAGWKLKELVAKTPIHFSENTWVYQRAQKDHKYVITCDVSHGKGLDYSAFHVIDVTSMPYEQVCVYHSNRVTPTDYTTVIATIAREYNEAQILVEVNDVGALVAENLLWEHEVDGLMFTAMVSGKKQVVPGFYGANSEKGLRQTKTTKTTGCSVLKLLIEQNKLIVNHEQTINELKTFSKKNASYEAEEGCHDDLVMSLVLFAWLSTQMYFKDLTDENPLFAIRDKSDSELTEDMLPFIRIDRGEEFVDEHTSFVDETEDAFRRFDRML